MSLCIPLGLFPVVRSNIIDVKNVAGSFQDIAFFKGGAGCLQVNLV